MLAAYIVTLLALLAMDGVQATSFAFTETELRGLNVSHNFTVGGSNVSVTVPTASLTEFTGNGVSAVQNGTAIGVNGTTVTLKASAKAPARLLVPSAGPLVAHELPHADASNETFVSNRSFLNATASGSVMSSDNNATLISNTSLALNTTSPELATSDLLRALNLCGTQHLELSSQFDLDGNFNVVNSTAQTIADNVTEAIKVPLFFHFICPSAEERNCPPREQADRLPQQMQVINDVYRTHGFQFYMMDIQTHISDDIFYARARADASKLDEFMKEKNIGDVQTLNVYIKDLQEPGLNGFANRIGWTELRRCNEKDAVIMDFRRLPGLQSQLANRPSEGKTLVHEVGHFLGLEHSFTGGCRGSDFQSTSPFADDTTSGDSAGKTLRSLRDRTLFERCMMRSCDGQAWNRTNNVMDYTPDNCRNEFTENQGKVMRYNWFQCRIL